MKQRPRLRRALIGAAALAPIALNFLSGCHIVSDAAYRDAQKVREWPQAFLEGVKADLKNYQRFR